jgi:hypothetical protein
MSLKKVVSTLAELPELVCAVNWAGLIEKKTKAANKRVVVYFIGDGII